MLNEGHTLKVKHPWFILAHDFGTTEHIQLHYLISSHTVLLMGKLYLKEGKWLAQAPVCCQPSEAQNQFVALRQCFPRAWCRHTPCWLLGFTLAVPFTAAWFWSRHLPFVAVVWHWLGQSRTRPTLEGQPTAASFCEGTPYEESPTPANLSPMDLCTQGCHVGAPAAAGLTPCPVQALSPTIPSILRRVCRVCMCVYACVCAYMCTCLPWFAGFPALFPQFCLECKIAFAFNKLAILQP